MTQYDICQPQSFAGALSHFLMSADWSNAAAATWASALAEDPAHSAAVPQAAVTHKIEGLFAGHGGTSC